MNKPFYGAASIPKADRRFYFLIQLIWLAIKMCLDQVLMIQIRRKKIMIFQSGRMKLLSIA